MKRLVWLLIATFLAATSQVQAVDVRMVPEEKCCCCEDEASACGMPDCTTVPTGCAQPAVQLQSPVRAVAKRVTAAPQASSREKFYEPFLPRVSAIPALPVTDDVTASAAGVPLFKEHCSFLI